MQNNNEKSPKEKFDTTMKTVTEKAKTKTGKIIGVVVLVIILLNIFWSMMENKVTLEVQAVRADIVALNTRLAEMEKGSVDLDAVRADAETIKKTGESFEAKLNAIVTAEEAKLENLTKELENQKAYIENLKSLSAGEGGK